MYYIPLQISPTPTPSPSPTPTPSPTPVPVKKSTPVGAIAGGVVGGLAVLGAFAFGIFYLCTRKSKNRENSPAEGGHTAYTGSTAPTSPQPLSPEPGKGMDTRVSAMSGEYDQHAYYGSQLGSPVPPYSPGPPAFTPQMAESPINAQPVHYQQQREVPMQTVTELPASVGQPQHYAAGNLVYEAPA
jgi:hypothetical protein